MKVITLSDSEFYEKCLELQRLVQADFAPDIILGIATGGMLVARNMFKDVEHKTVDCGRPSTRLKKKESSLFKFIRLMPESVRNFLRICEAKILKARSSRWNPLPEVSLPDEKSFDGKAVLVVDDAVDSGRTLRAVMKALQTKTNAARIMTAVITVTQSENASLVDYSLFSNILIRFPWSMDYRKKK